MAGLKEIRRRLQSVRKTKKITYAMKLVSAAKLRKAQDAVLSSREYTDALGQLLAQMEQDAYTLDFVHPLMAARDQVQRVRLVVIGGSRGLCGAYNTNVNRMAERQLKQIREERPGAEVESVLLGKKVAEYFRLRKYPYLKSYEDLPEDGHRWPIEEIGGELEEAYLNGEVDEVRTVYTKFLSAISQRVMCEQLLPVSSHVSHEGQVNSGTTLFEPSANEVLSQVVPRVLRAQFRQACLDSKASEHGSRMTAMDAASKNSDDIIYKLTLQANKLRQSGITGELLDIIGGAESLK